MRGFIYRLFCLNDDVKECYIGSCWDIKNRMRSHKFHSTNKNSPKHNFKVYTFIRANGGWINFDYEYFVVNVIDKTHLQMKEQERMDIEINPMLNSKRAYTDAATRAEYLKQYSIDNKKSIKQRKKQYYINLKQKQHYINNKQKKNKKYNCECGGKYQHHSKSKHLKTIKHQCYEIMLHA